MIVQISIENYLSIKDRIVLSLDSSASKKLPQNTIRISDKEKLLKSAVIYGPNASGKSNIIKSIEFVKKMVKVSHQFNVNDKIPWNPYRLDEKSSKKPSKFEILFIQNKIKYKYGFSCNDKKITEEYLYYWPSGRESLIFRRSSGNRFRFTADKTQQNLIKRQIRDNTLYLSRATQLGYEKIKDAYSFFDREIIIKKRHYWECHHYLEDLSQKIYENQNIKNKLIEVLQKADFGGINDIKINRTRRRLGYREARLINMNKFAKQTNRNAHEYEIKFVHKKTGGRYVEFNVYEESTGTIKTLHLLGHFFEILKRGKTLVIDELESSLHPAITTFLVKLFNSKEHNRRNAQLIFTTHDTTLLNPELLRRDQIYICSKRPNKHTVLTSLLDFDIREDSDFKSAYLSGRVGGVPYIDETFVD